ncbi:sperm acrosome-associated protein 5-like [Pelodytes ibericus]
MIFFIVILLTVVAESQTIDRCTLVQSLRSADIRVKNYTVEDYTCVAYHISNYDSFLHQSTTEYGIFQINSYWWCNDGVTVGRKNLCGVLCTDLLNTNLTDDIKCLRRIVQEPDGLAAWDVWNSECKGKDLRDFTSGC